MSDFFTSLIRTYVPIIVGAVAGWLTAKGVHVDANAVAGLTAFLGGLFSAVYYLAVRLLEKKFPSAGVLLGSTKKPVYTNPAYSLK